MKLLDLTVVMALASTALADYMSTCAINHPHIANAIGKFCQNKGLMVPSRYADNGMSGDNYPDAQIWISGNCKPAQWVPQKYCFSQFWNMCANRPGPNVMQTRKYGNKGCQTWGTFTGKSASVDPKS